MANYGVLSDLQIPFEHPKALEFALYCKRHFKIAKENWLCVGDELDILHGSMYEKDADGSMTPKSELKAARERIEEWGAVFPLLKIATSNHGLRWVRKAAHAQIPTEILRSYQEIYQTPPGWQWKDEWVFKEKHPFLMFHGMGYGGMYAYRQAPVNKGISTVFGHLHSSAGIAYVNRSDRAQDWLWGMNVGCLIDPQAYAFAYGKENKNKPNLGMGLASSHFITSPRRANGTGGGSGSP